MPHIELALVGAGDRGTKYTRYATMDGRARLTAVAEPDPRRRDALLAEHPDALSFGDWRDLAERPRIADAVVIATLDADHVEPAVRFAELGYHVLLEKPMAIDLEDCRRIVAAAERSGVMFAVCHVLRYTTYTQQVKDVLDSGRLGEIVTIEHLEPVGWWHHAHSYVRGNWRRTDEATFMLLAKSCHDLDWLTYVMGRRVTRVSSFGGLKHFTAENRPAGAADRCLDCAVAADCPYDARRIYQPYVGEEKRWPLAVLTDDPSEAGLLRALREGPYGRCVYACDNDVVDHQVVNLDFDGGATASFTMTAFSPAALRKTRIFGTHGFLEGDGARLTVTDFVTGETEVIDTNPPTDGHGGGDQGLITAFLDALDRDDPAAILSAPRESLHSHEIAWAAEESRLTGTVVAL
ncbi:Gfo/Idh/MocA family oxidoreductase [Nonomuraea sp. NPDC049504]|uniref:Gfo/Idh/MocA family protein n=1 Tax=Nonomuraea sp. NPDC049504 TaxID=3154729 RepID=UPI003437C5E4